MEIYNYWLILRRRWWIPALLLVVVAAASLLTFHAPAMSYQATMRFTISVSADRNLHGVDPVLTSSQASEYIRDDFVEVLHSDAFAQDVNANLDARYRITKDNISAAVEKQRRILSMTITVPEEPQARAVAEAAAQALETKNAKYFKQLGAEGATVTVIDGPAVAGVAPGLRERLDVPIRLVLALVAGILLAFVVDYFDDTVREAREVEGMGMPVLGEIPREPRTRTSSRKT